MSATDWEARELESASRERLLVEIGVLRGKDIKSLESLEKQVLDLQQELIAAKDFAMGAASRAGEAHAQLGTTKFQLSAAQKRVEFLSKYINRMRDSTTWKIGRFVMLPVRVLKKITGKAS